MYLEAIIQPTILSHTMEPAMSAKSIQNIFQLDLGFELGPISLAAIQSYWMRAYLDDLI